MVIFSMISHARVRRFSFFLFTLPHKSISVNTLWVKISLFRANDNGTPTH